MATNIGSIAGDSSFSYGSRAFGPLGLRLLTNNENTINDVVIGTTRFLKYK